MLLNLYKRANGNLGKAQRGILVIDEIDKKKSVAIQICWSRRSAKLIIKNY